MSADAMCPKCRHPLNPAVQFCENCGARAAAGPIKPASAIPAERRVIAAPESPIMTLISAGLFLYVGFVFAPVGISGNALYDGSVTAFTWGARFVGIGLLLVAGLSFTRLAVVFLVDMIVSFVAAAGCVLVGAIWLMHSDMQGVLVLLFGVFNSSAAAASWRRWNASRA